MKIEIGRNGLNIEAQQIDPSIAHPAKALSFLDSDDWNACIRISVDDDLVILYHLRDFNSGLNDLSILYVDEVNTLFIGGKSRSLTIDLTTGKHGNVFNHFLFRGFQKLDNGYVLDYGETDCLLRKYSGEIIRAVCVEPPWEMEQKGDGVLFKCDGIAGEVWLPY